jgi:transcriptional regulator with XRE-family HTH domain
MLTTIEASERPRPVDDFLCYRAEVRAKIVGKKLRELREARGLTQPQVGELVGRSKQNIQQIEAGVREPGVDTLDAVAQAVGARMILEIVPAESQGDAVWLHGPALSIARGLQALPAERLDVVLNLVRAAIDAPLTGVEAAVRLLEMVAGTVAPSTPRGADEPTAPGARPPARRRQG